MLKNLTIKQIEEIITTAEQLNAKHLPSDRGVSPGSHDFRPYMKDRKMLVQNVADLTHDARMELMALMWIGRDFDGTFMEALKYAHENSDQGDVGYITDKSSALPTYLRKGLKKLHAEQKKSN